MHFGGRLTQPGIDGAVSVTIPTGINADTDFVLKIHRITFDLDSAIVSSWAIGLADVNLQVSAVGNNSGFTELFTIAVSSGAANTAMFLPTQHVNNLTEDFPLIGDESITVSFDSGSTGAINALDWRIDYDRVVLSPGELNKALLRVF